MNKENSTSTNAPTNNQPAGIFLNGRAQIIEMLRIMDPVDRDTLLKNVRKRNPAMANELLEQSITIDHLTLLADPEIQLLFGHFPATILGVAMKGLSQELQRRLLSLAPRQYAEEAYTILTANISNEKRDVPKAQSKIMNVMIALYRARKIHL